MSADHLDFVEFDGPDESNNHHPNKTNSMSSRTGGDFLSTPLGSKRGSAAYYEPHNTSGGNNTNLKR